VGRIVRRDDRQRGRFVVEVAALHHDRMLSRPNHDDGNAADRTAVEHVTGHPLPDAWPAAAMPVGTRVQVVKDANWDGPWAREFDGVIDALGAPEPVRHKLARPGELAYWVRFDGPQLDSAGDGPYRKAQIWDRYLRPI
jgi:hypothetical protein